MDFTPDYSRAFSADELGGIPLARETVEPLLLPTGQLVACDAMAFETVPREPFDRALEPGSYPVELAIATLKVVGGEQQVPAFARVVFGEGPATRWELAVTASQPLDELEPGRVYGFPVETGVAAYMDGLAQEILIEDREDHFAEDEPEHEEPDIHRELDFAMKGEVTCRRGAIPILVEDEPPSNIVGFSSGPGDGVYPSYWGFDAAGELVELITDFHVVPRETVIDTGS